MKKISFIIIAMTLAILEGCISYTDPKVKKLNQSEYAKIAVEISLKVIEIDGKKVLLNWLAPIDEIKIPPGKHYFKIIWNNRNIRTEPITTDLELEAGASYRLIRTIDFQSNKWSFKLEKQ